MHKEIKQQKNYKKKFDEASSMLAQLISIVIEENVKRKNKKIINSLTTKYNEKNT